MTEVKSLYDIGFGHGYAKAMEEAGQIKHGRWCKTGQSLVYPDKFRNYFCSVCGFELDTHIRKEPNYCSNCGAKMDEVEDGSDKEL